MAGPGDNGREDSQDPEAGWPSRFSEPFVAVAGLLLLAAAVAAALILRDILAPPTRVPTSKQTMTYVFALAGFLMLLLGALFGLVEARRAPTAEADQPTAEVVPLGRAISFQYDPASNQVTATMGKVISAISKEKRSTAAWGIGVSLLVLAGAASGLVSLSVGDQDPTADETPTEESTEEPTEVDEGDS